MGTQDSAVPFLKAGPTGTVRPKTISHEDHTNLEATSACTLSSKGGVIKTLFRESTLTVKMIYTMIDQEERDSLTRDDSQERSAKQRGKVAHTTRPVKPESVNGEVKPLESRMKSAERY